RPPPRIAHSVGCAAWPATRAFATRRRRPVPTRRCSTPRSSSPHRRVRGSERRRGARLARSPPPAPTWRSPAPGPRTTSSAENPHDRTPEGTSDAPEERETLDADREDEAFDRSEGIAGHDFEAAEGGEAVDEADRAHRRRRVVAARSDR